MTEMESSRCDVAIIGDSLEAWTTALFLKRRAAGVFDTIVVAGGAEEAGSGPLVSLADPSSHMFFKKLSISEDELFRQADASFFLGTEVASATPFVRAFGQYGSPANAIAFHHYWKRMVDAGTAATYDQYALAAGLARAGGFVHPSDNPRAIESSFRYGYAFDTEQMTSLVRSKAVALGVQVAPGAVARTPPGTGDHTLAHVEMRDGSVIKPVLIVRCDRNSRRPGMEAPDAFHAWEGFPEAVSVLESGNPNPPANLSMHTVSVAARRFTVAIPLRSRTIERVITWPASDQAMVRPGRLQEPWSGNEISIGARACALPGLHVAEFTVLQRMLNLLEGLLPVPGQPTTSVSAEFNRRATCMLDRISDFEALYFQALASGGQAVRQAFDNPYLERKAEQFESRGRLVMYDDEAFPEQDWITSFIGLGIVPERVSPIALAAPIEAVHQNYERLRLSIARASERLPRQTTYIDHLLAGQTEETTDAV